MPKYRVSELEGDHLDIAVAIAHGWRVAGRSVALPGSEEWLCIGPAEYTNDEPDHFAPSRSWGDGGPIIKRGRISVQPVWHAETGEPADHWVAHFRRPPCECWIGPTPLIAAMRAYVSSKLGEEVELP